MRLDSYNQQVLAGSRNQQQILIRQETRYFISETGQYIKQLQRFNVPDLDEAILPSRYQDLLLKANEGIEDSHDCDLSYGCFVSLLSK